MPPLVRVFAFSLGVSAVISYCYYVYLKKLSKKKKKKRLLARNNGPCASSPLTTQTSTINDTSSNDAPFAEAVDAILDANADAGIVSASVAVLDENPINPICRADLRAESPLPPSPQVGSFLGAVEYADELQMSGDHKPCYDILKADISRIGVSKSSEKLRSQLLWRCEVQIYSNYNETPIMCRLCSFQTGACLQ
jgi:hypothetical protein